MYKKNKANPYIQQYDDAVKDVSKILKEIEKDKNKNVFETVALFYILTDLAVVNAKKDRQPMRELMEHVYYTYLNGEELNKKMAGRVNLYGRLIRGEKARGHWLLAGEKMTEYRDNPMTNYLLAYGDFLIFGWDSDNYFKEKLQLINPVFSMNAAATMLSKIYPYMDSYFSKVYSM